MRSGNNKIIITTIIIRGRRRIFIERTSEVKDNRVSTCSKVFGMNQVNVMFQRDFLIFLSFFLSSLLPPSSSRSSLLSRSGW